MRGYFITGTDTGVGKTCVAAALLHRLAQGGARVVGMKPVAAGVEPDGRYADVDWLQAASNVDLPAAWRNPYAFPAAIAPHLAAAQAGVEMDFGQLHAAFRQLSAQVDHVVVEGAGGLLVPLGPQGDFADLALRLDLPVVLVVGLRLGCLNHARLTAMAIRVRGLRFAGWVGNVCDARMPALEANLASLHELLPAPCLGVVPRLTGPQPGNVAKYLKDI
jgi:dethiobiotin synthetase